MPDRRWFAAALDISVVIFVASALLGLWVAYDRDLSVTLLTAVVGGGLLYLGLSRVQRPEHLMLAGRLLAGAGLVLSLYFIAQYGHQAYTVKSGFIARLGQLTTFLPDLGGPLLHPNVLASFVSGALPVGAALLGLSGSRLARIGWGAALLVMGYALFLSASRGGWLAVAGAALLATVLVVARLPRRSAGLAGLAGAVLTAAGVAAVWVQDWSQWPLVASIWPRALQRSELYQNSLKLAQDYFFTGIGLGDTFGPIYARYSQFLLVPSLNHAHNLPLAIWLNQGLPGLLAFLALTVSVYGLVFQTLRHVRPTLIFHGAWLGVTAMWLHGLTDAPQYSGSLPLFLGVLGLTAAAGRAAPSEGAEPAGQVRSLWAAVVLAIVGGVAVLGVGRQPLLAAWATNQGALVETRSDLTPGLTPAERDGLADEAAAWYERALAEQPDWPNALRRLGNLRLAHGDFAGAIVRLEAALARDPHYGPILKGLGLAYTWSGRIEAAAVLFHQLADPAAMEQELYTWGYYRSEQGQPLLTAYAWETAQAMYPDKPNPDLWLLIAGKYREAGEREAARRWYEQVLARVPDQPQALSGLAELGP